MGEKMTLQELQEKIEKTQVELKSASEEYRKAFAKLFVLQNSYTQYLMELEEECEKKKRT